MAEEKTEHDPADKLDHHAFNTFSGLNKDSLAEEIYNTVRQNKISRERRKKNR